MRFRFSYSVAATQSFVKITGTLILDNQDNRATIKLWIKSSKTKFQLPFGFFFKYSTTNLQMAFFYFIFFLQFFLFLN